MCLVFGKSACPFRQVKTKIYLLKSPFFKNSLAGASGQVLMLVPDVESQQIHKCLRFGDDGILG